MGNCRKLSQCGADLAFPMLMIYKRECSTCRKNHNILECDVTSDSSIDNFLELSKTGNPLIFCSLIAFSGQNELKDVIRQEIIY